MPLTCDATLERLFPLLLGGDRAGALELVESTLRAGRTASTIHHDVLRPLAVMVDRLHRSEQITTPAYAQAFDLLDYLAARLRSAGTATPPVAAPRPHRPQSRFVRRSFDRGVLILRLAGPSLGEREARIAGEEIQSILRGHGEAVHTLVLDFTDVRMLSSIGLNLCIDVRNTARILGVRTIAYGLRRELRKLFSLTRVDKLYEMPRTKEELRRALAV